MATFQAQVEGLTGLSIGTSPTTAELTQFLTDGAKDVINKISAIHPDKINLFCTESVLSDDTGLTVDSGVVASVVRANGVEAEVYPALEINPAIRYRASDSTSIYYQTKQNPAYYILNGKLHVIPAAENATTEKALVSYISYPTVAFGDQSIAIGYKSVSSVASTTANPTRFNAAFGHTLIDGDIVRLSGFTGATELNGITSIVEGVSGTIFYLQGITSQDVGSNGFVETIASGFPSQYEYLVPIYAAIKSLDNAMSAKGYPKVGGVEEELTAGMDADSSGYGTDVDFLDVSKWFSVAGEFIEDEQDNEMAAVQIQKISAYIQAWQSQLQGNITEYQWMQGRQQLLIQQYASAFGQMTPKEEK